MILNIEPMAKQSTRFSGGRAYTPSDLKKYVEDLKHLISQQWKGKPLDCPIMITKLYFCFSPIQKNKKLLDNFEYIEKSTKPDLDNLCKPLFDAMQGIVFNNDSQIWSIENMKKLYSKDPKIIIEVKYD